MRSPLGQVLIVFAAVAVVVGAVVIAVVVKWTPTDAASARTTAARVAGRDPSVRMTVRPSPGRVTPPPRPKPLPADVTGCHVGQGTTQLAAVPPAVTDRVNHAWDRIENWLAAHAPATHVSSPPADPQRIAEAQRQVGAPFPPDLIASLRRHDGSGPNGGDVFELPPFYHLISTQEIGNEAKILCDILVSSGEPGSVGSWWHGRYVPIAVDGSGEALFVDERSGRDGRLGEHDNEGDVNFDRWPSTLTELLEQTADALETGHDILGYCRPHVTPQGVLDWDIVH